MIEKIEVGQTEEQSLPGIAPVKRVMAAKKPKAVSGSRWSIALLLLISVLLCLIFYFSTNTQEISKNLLVPINTAASLFKTEPAQEANRDLLVVAEIKKLTDSLQGQYGFYVERLSRGDSYGLAQSQIFPSASLMKLPVMVSVYLAAEQGKFTLNDNYVLRPEDKRSGAGFLYTQANGKVWTYRQLVCLMGEYSDNTAFTAMRNILGDSYINQTIGGWGLSQTSLAEFETSPADMGKFFSTLYRGKKLSLENRNEILDCLTDTQYEDRIPAGVPTDIKVSHKVGTDSGVYADAGIIFSRNPYVLVIMTEGAFEKEALEVVPKMTKIIWEHENSN